MSKDHSSSPDSERGLVVEPAKPQLKQPPLYKVVLLNDDYTPMDFVVRILEDFFSMNRKKRPRLCCMSTPVAAECVGSILMTLQRRKWRKSTSFHAATSIRCYVLWKKLNWKPPQRDSRFELC